MLTEPYPFPPGTLSRAERAQYERAGPAGREALVLVAKARVAAFENDMFPRPVSTGLGTGRRICEQCEERFTAQRSSARYCSKGCKIEAELARRRQATPLPKRRRSQRWR